MTQFKSVISLGELLNRYRPGAAPTWHDQETDVQSRLCLCCGKPGHYQAQLEEHLSRNGLNEGIYLNDGFVEDGNHRVVAAIRLEIENIPLESAEAAGERWLRDHGSVDWTKRKWGDITLSEASWVITDGLMKIYATN